MRTTMGWTTLMVLIATGCSHQPKLFCTNAQSSTESPNSGSSENSASRLTKDEEDKLKEVAWNAAHSPDVIEQFDLERTARAPMKLKKEGITCYVDRNTEEKVEVVIPDAGDPDVFHGHYVGVTVDRRTLEVLEMKKSFWP